MATTICWNCKVTAHMAPITDVTMSHDADLVCGIYRCDACGAPSLAWARPNRPVNADALWRMKETPAGLINVAFQEDAVAWAPDPVRGKEYPDVEPKISDAAAEAWACHTIRSYRAASIMARAVIEATAKAKDVEGKGLLSKVDKLYEAQLLSAGARDAAHDIRLNGNEMAHGDFDEPVSEPDSFDTLDLMDRVLREVFQDPAALQRRRENRAKRRLTGK